MAETLALPLTLARKDVVLAFSGMVITPSSSLRTSNPDVVRQTGVVEAVQSVSIAARKLLTCERLYASPEVPTSPRYRCSSHDGFSPKAILGVLLILQLSLSTGFCPVTL